MGDAVDADDSDEDGDAVAERDWGADLELVDCWARPKATPHALTVKIAKDVLDDRFAAYYWANRAIMYNAILQAANGVGDISAKQRNAAVQTIRKFRKGRLPASAVEMVLGGKLHVYEDVINSLLKRLVVERNGRDALYFFDVDLKEAAATDETAAHYILSAGYFLYPEVYGVADDFDVKAIEPTVVTRTPAELEAFVDERLKVLIRVPALGAKKDGPVEPGDAVMVASLTAVRGGRRWEQGCARNLTLYTTMTEPSPDDIIPRPNVGAWPASTQYADQLIGASAKDRKVLTVEIDGVKTDLHIHIDTVHAAVLSDPDSIAKRYGYPNVKVWRDRLLRMAEANEERIERDAIKRSIVDAMAKYDVTFEPFPDYWAVRHIEKLRASGFQGSDPHLANEVLRVFHETVLLREYARRIGVAPEPDAVINWALQNLKIERVTTESNKALAEEESK